MSDNQFSSNRNQDTSQEGRFGPCGFRWEPGPYSLLTWEYSVVPPYWKGSAHDWLDVVAPLPSEPLPLVLGIHPDELDVLDDVTNGNYASDVSILTQGDELARQFVAKAQSTKSSLCRPIIGLASKLYASEAERSGARSIVLPYLSKKGGYDITGLAALRSELSRITEEHRVVLRQEFGGLRQRLAIPLLACPQEQVLHAADNPERTGNRVRHLLNTLDKRAEPYQFTADDSGAVDTYWDPEKSFDWVRQRATKLTEPIGGESAAWLFKTIEEAGVSPLFRPPAAPRRLDWLRELTEMALLYHLRHSMPLRMELARLTLRLAFVEEALRHIARGEAVPEEFQLSGAKPKGPGSKFYNNQEDWICVAKAAYECWQEGTSEIKLSEATADRLRKNGNGSLKVIERPYDMARKYAADRVLPWRSQ